MKVNAVFVLYNPDINLTLNSIKSILRQVSTVYVIDNGSYNVDLISEALLEFNNVRLIKLGENKGVAYALNVGIKASMESGCAFILTSDQDSIFPDDFIEKFNKELMSFGNYEDVAAFSASFFDIVSNEKSKVLVKSGLSYKLTESSERFLSIAASITSGMLINTKNLPAVGYMEDDLFIDWVDNEWCFRAICRDFRIISFRNLVFSHHMGNSTEKLLWKKIPVRTPTRYYYIVRNAFYLSLHSAYLPFLFRTKIFSIGIKYIIGYTLIKGNHLKNMKYCLRGMVDGILERMGKLSG